MTARVIIEFDSPEELQQALLGLSNGGPKHGKRRANAENPPTELQQKIISALLGEGPMSLGGLRLRLGLSHGQALGNCRSLQRKGLVTRKDGFVELTEEGRVSNGEAI